MSIFSQINVRPPKRSTFNCTHENLLTCNFGQIVPCLATECVPGDTFKVSSNFLCRTAPLWTPAFARIDAFVHYFHVPFRLIWADWQRFRTGGDNPNDYSSVHSPVFRVFVFLVQL